MAWDECHSQLVSIVEDVEVTTTEHGVPRGFKHCPEGYAAADTRSFWFEIMKMSMKGNRTHGLPDWQRFEVDLVRVYRNIDDVTRLGKIIAADELAITQQMFDPIDWDQPTSTIESLALGDETIGQSEIEYDEEFGAIVRTRLHAEFRES